MGKHTAFNGHSLALHVSGKGSHSSRGKSRFTIFLKRNAGIIEQVNRCSSSLLPLALSSTSCNSPLPSSETTQHGTVQGRDKTLTQTKPSGDPELFQSDQCSDVWSSSKHPRLRNRSVVSVMQNWLWGNLSHWEAVLSDSRCHKSFQWRMSPD